MQASKKLTTITTKAIMEMVNVTEYSLDWRSLPLNEGTLSFFAATQKAFSSNLRKLELSANVAQFDDILMVTNFSGVEELVIGFLHDNQVATAASENERIFVKRVAPFINSFGPSIRSLSIVSWAKGSHSKFFGALGPFSNLQFLSVEIQFGEHQIEDASGLFHFLHAHISVLRTLELCSNRLYRRWADPYGMGGSSKDQWLRLSKQYFPGIALHANLDSLTITSLDHRLALSLINGSIASLTRLGLSGRYLEVNEVAEIVGLFEHRPFQLQNLSLDIITITPHLLDTLANGLPRLASLALIIKDNNVSSICPFTIPSSINRVYS
jgi:hypothetical protein